MKKIICSVMSILLILCLFGTTFTSFAEGWDTEPVPFPCDEHVFVTKTVKAGAKANGYTYKECKNCGEKTNTVEIPGIAGVSLSSTQFYYNGKVHTPTVSVRDMKGNVISPSNYKLTYVNNKVVGKKTYAHVVFNNEKYSAVLNSYFTISLAKPVVSVKTSAAAVALRWKKVAGAQFYRVYQYNTLTKKYVRVANTKNISYTIKNKAAGSTYYYLVRAYFVNANKEEFLSPYTVKDNVKVVTLCKAPAVKAAVSGKTVILKWAKVSGAASYSIYRYNAATKKYVTVVSKYKGTKNLTKAVIKNPTPAVKTVYITKTGKRYHYDSKCGNGKYYASTLSEARKKGLTPCQKCVHT